jgi:hypothetical protein
MRDGGPWPPLISEADRKRRFEMAKKMGGKGKPGFKPKGDRYGKDTAKKHGGKGRI